MWVKDYRLVIDYSIELKHEIKVVDVWDYVTRDITEIQPVQYSEQVTVIENQLVTETYDEEVSVPIHITEINQTTEHVDE